MNAKTISPNRLFTSNASQLIGRGAKRVLRHAFGKPADDARVHQSGKHGDAVLQGLRDWDASDVVFDVGANDGRTILRIDPLLNSPRIFAFEPVSRTFEVLCERTREMQNVQRFRYAIGKQTESRTIFINRVASTSSFHPDFGDRAGEEEVRIKTLDQVAAELGVDHIHYLKIDTEGFELEVLSGAVGLLGSSRISILQAEVGFSQCAKDFASLYEVQKFLRPYGYLLAGIFNQCHSPGTPPGLSSSDEVKAAKAHVLAYADALFIRADMEPK